MPATEKTWYDLKLLHVLFGVASIVMLIATVLMLAKDHARGWKAFQLQDRAIDQWQLTARIDGEKTALSAITLAQRTAALELANSAMIDVEAVQRFVRESQRAAEARGDRPPLDIDAMKRILTEQLRPRVDAVKKARGQSEAARGTWLEKLAAVRDAAGGEARDVKRLQQEADVAAVNAREAHDRLLRAERAARQVRHQVLDRLQQVAKAAKLREENLARDTKFKKADLTATISEKAIAIGSEKSPAEIADVQRRTRSLRQEVTRLTEQLDAAKDHRVALDAILKQILAEEQQAAKALEQTQADLKRLHATLEESKPNWGEWIIRQPILDAFYTGKAVKIQQIWLPHLTINNNFEEVARFDRCITCHRAIAKTAPGSPVDPAYVGQTRTVALLETPDHAPHPEPQDDGTTRQPSLQTVYGIRLADTGRVHHDDVTIEFVLPDSRGARAGLRTGDVIEKINDARILARRDVDAYLLGNLARFGRPASLAIRRGLPHPFVSHPRLDLFVGSMSPHTMGEMGCTICHDGQGSATEFQWASHTPDNPRQALAWHQEYGWFDNHHWLFPMRPARFVESGCLKCHHDVTELEPSERFPDPPAPKVVEGYRLVQQFGCFGCHEINGFDGPNRRIGPDLRAEPNFYAVAQALLRDEGLNNDERRWARQLVAHPEDANARHRLMQSIVADQANVSRAEAPRKPRFAAATYRLAGMLKDVEIPGTLRKPGPSLRYIGSKVDFRFLYSWIHKPSDFRPSTRMPQFFGQWEHLAGHSLEVSQQFEPIEIRAISEYLLSASQPFEPIVPPAGITEPPSAERGKRLFQTRGCLGCHRLDAFPGIAQDQGPDLSRVGAKFNTPKGRKWLYSWLKRPNHYHVRTRMPNLFLDPIAVTDAQGKPTGKVSDPAADIAAFLLTFDNWKPAAPPRELSAPEQRTLQKLAVEYLTAFFPRRRAERYVIDGVPNDLAANLKGAEKELIELTPENRVHRQLLYVGERTFQKYGCFGCHDIPGFEDAKPIGTSLADWGRKDSSKLAFELIHNFLADKGVDGHGTGHGKAAGHGGHGLAPRASDPDTGYFLQAIAAHRREGFIWQKLRMPRSFDYQKTGDKGYNERLRMPRFPLNDAQREAMITFVLGLVAQPPAEQYVYHPSPRRKAIVAGRQVIDKYHCTGCHILRMDRWEFDYHPTLSDDEPGDFESPPESAAEFPFLKTRVTPEEVAASIQIDKRGMRHAVVHGMPEVSEETGKPVLVDEDGVPLDKEDLADSEIASFYRFILWKPALIDGLLRDVGVQDLLIPNGAITKYPPLGGALARYLFPIVIAHEKAVNPQVKGGEAWGWLPPPLIREGRKVQADWLHDFLLDPYRIRPAAIMRMPRFNMSPDEATKIADYFAAIDGAQYPYAFAPQRSEMHLAGIRHTHPERLNNALKIVVNNNYCVKCHLVGDFTPQGSPTALAPNLDQVYSRLRPTFIRDWIANPKRHLPYTGMPVNIPYKDAPPEYGGVSQDLFPGTSLEQLSGLVDFLMNFDHYSILKTSIRSLVTPAGGEVAGAGAGKPGAGASTANKDVKGAAKGDGKP